jgi:formylglycine-generating enzyme required for sulfatase activity
MIHVSNTFFEMCFVEGGTFTMGSDTSDAQADEQPLHEVTLSNYYIGQTEVTQYLWRIVMGSDNNPSTTKGDNLPVTNISWDNAQKFVQRLSEMTGKPFRLPTEAEWEYAARGGQRSQGYVYAGSNNLDSVAWHPSNCTQPQAVGKKKPNELGIFDMTGNVWEYCSDYYAPYEASAQLNPQGPASSPDGTHVTRGGGWRQNPGYDTSLGYCRTTNRAALPTSDIVGLRIVLEVEK